MIFLYFSLAYSSLSLNKMAFLMSLFEGFCLKLTSLLRSEMVMGGKGTLEWGFLGTNVIVWFYSY